MLSVKPATVIIDISVNSPMSIGIAMGNLSLVGVWVDIVLSSLVSVSKYTLLNRMCPLFLDNNFSPRSTYSD